MDESLALSARETCSDIETFEFRVTPNTLSVDTLSAPSINGCDDSRIAFDLGLKTISSFVLVGWTLILLVSAHSSMLRNSSLIVPILDEPTSRLVPSANFD